MWPLSSSNEQIIKTKRAARDKALADCSAVGSAIGSAIVSATASEIVSKIEQGEWTASQVLEAFIARAAFAHAKTNCLTEILFDYARQLAGELDEEFARTKTLKGPLHGVPVSIKDQFEIEGFDATIGFTQWANKPSTRNADIVRQLLAAGAVPFVKTNVPQTMLAFECSNPLFGRTLNPYNDGYTCGGSSGGEGAVLAMDGSCIGIGTDIGGSLRIPAAYCGIYSLKPAHGRVSYFGGKGTVPGFEAVPTVAGPMARSVNDLELVSRALFGAPSQNNSTAPLPFREVELPAKLKFGFYTSDNYIKASPACKRAVLETVDALRKAGHECIEFELPNVSSLFNTFPALTSADGYSTLLSHLGPDKKESALFLTTLGPKLPFFIRGLVGWILESIVGDAIFANTLRMAKRSDVTNFWRTTALKNQHITDFYDQVWSKYGFDGIIAPVQAVPQLPHGGCDNFSVLSVSTIVYNLLDLPAGCIPVTRVDPAKDQVTEEWTTGPGLGSRIVENGLYRGKKPLYNPESLKGMPVGVQIVAKKWEEEKVLAMMDIADRALGERGFGPGAWNTHFKGESSA